jgi:predicted glycogen debranching enzyme
MIKFERDICTDFAAASSREWLETNGIGGFASSTVSGANSRRYHGLLTAATKPPLGRIVMLSKFEETVTIGASSFELSANQYPGQVHPQGFQYLKSFVLILFRSGFTKSKGSRSKKRFLWSTAKIRPSASGRSTGICGRKRK